MACGFHSDRSPLTVYRINFIRLKLGVNGTGEFHEWGQNDDQVLCRPASRGARTMRRTIVQASRLTPRGNGIRCFVPAQHRASKTFGAVVTHRKELIFLQFKGHLPPRFPAHKIVPSFGIVNTAEYSATPGHRRVATSRSCRSRTCQSCCFRSRCNTCRDPPAATNGAVATANRDRNRRGVQRMVGKYCGWFSASERKSRESKVAVDQTRRHPIDPQQQLIITIAESEAMSTAGTDVGSDRRFSCRVASDSELAGFDVVNAKLGVATGQVDSATVLHTGFDQFQHQLCAVR